MTCGVLAKDFFRSLNKPGGDLSWDVASMPWYFSETEDALSRPRPGIVARLGSV